MKLIPITDLIDTGTRIAMTMTPTGKYTSVYSGYLALSVQGKLIQRRIHDMMYNLKYDTCLYIVYNKVNYAINIPCKPISGAFNVESLKI